jgi:hypothetical protein
MGLLSKIFGGGTAAVVNGIGGIIDKFKLDPSEKENFKSEFEKLLRDKDVELEKTLRSELETKQKIMVTELSQGDNYTKRARPTIVYSGLAFIFINYCLVPIVQSIAGAHIDPLKLPVEFWVAWGGVVGVYGIGRSIEKRGIRNVFTQAATGNSPTKDSGLLMDL